MYSTIIVCIIIYIQYKLLDVLDLLLFVALYTYRLNYYVLLPYSYWEIVLGEDHPKRPARGPNMSETDFPTHPSESIPDF